MMRQLAADLRGTRFRRALLTMLLLVFPGAPAIAQTSCGDQVQVRPGDTLFSIAERCDTSVEALRQANPSIDSRDMRVGLYLHVPGGAAPAPVPSGRTYTFRPGDTLYSIAEILGVSIDAVLAANPGLDPNDIPIGAVIRLPDGADAPVAPGPTDTSVSISPESGPVGTRVEINAFGFPPEAPLKIGSGPPQSEYSVQERMRAGRDGAVRAQLPVPERAEGHDRWVFVVATRDNRINAVSDPFDITDRDGDGAGVTVTGTLTREGVECPSLRGDSGGLYMLAGDVEGFEPGARVTVEGRIAETSICMQGITIEVDEIRAAE